MIKEMFSKLCKIQTIFVIVLVIIWGYGLCNLENFSNVFIDYFLNTLIVFDFCYIKDCNKRARRCKQKINSIKDIKNKKLDRNVIGESVDIIYDAYAKNFIVYDEYNDKKRNKLWVLGIVNIIVIILGILGMCTFNKDYNSIIFICKIMVTFANIIYFYVGEIEKSEIQLEIFDLDVNKYRKNEEDINSFYKRNMTNIFLQEKIIEFGKNLYYVVIFMKEKKIYRIVYSALVSILGIAFVLYIHFTNGILNTIVVENNVIFNLYPNIILLLFCVISNMEFDEKINEHYITIREGDLSDIENSEIDSIYFKFNDNKMKAKQFTLKIYKKTKIESMFGKRLI